MTSPKQLLEDFDIKPKKSLGQNFLHDPNALARIVESAELPADATVVEIGAGTGALTRVLAQTSQRVIAIETDERLRPVLSHTMNDLYNVEIHWGDFLKANLESLIGSGPFYVVANVPYYITSAILRKLLDRPHRPHRLVLTVQKEVAERILAEPGNMSILAVSVQFYGQPVLVTRLNPAVFWPRPDVESAVIRIDVYETPVVDVPDETTFFKIVRAGFSQKRKQLKNALAGGLGLKSSAARRLLETAEIDASRRAETLKLEEWARLSWAYQQAN